MYVDEEGAQKDGESPRGLDRRWVTQGFRLQNKNTNMYMDEEGAQKDDESTQLFGTWRPACLWMGKELRKMVSHLGV